MNINKDILNQYVQTAGNELAKTAFQGSNISSTWPKPDPLTPEQQAERDERHRTFKQEFEQDKAKMQAFMEQLQELCKEHDVEMHYYDEDYGGKNMYFIHGKCSSIDIINNETE